MANEPKIVSFGANKPISGDARPDNSGQAFESSIQELTHKSVKVKAGDTLAKIAKRNNIDLQTLLAANTQFDANSVGGGHNWSRKAHGKRDADCLRPGETIRIPVAVIDTQASGTAVPANLTTRVLRINEAPDRNSAPKYSADIASATVTKEAAVTIGAVQNGVDAPATLAAPAPDPKTPDPEVKPPEIEKKDYGHQLIVLAGGGGPKGADNRVGLIMESLDSGTNPNTGTYQFSGGLTMPGRVQEPHSRLDATARMTLFSLGRKPLTYKDAEGKEQSIETLGVKLGGMKAENRFASVSVIGNVSGLPVGTIQQPDGTAVDGKSPTSPAHFGVGASLGHIDGFYAWGVGNGAVRDAAGNTNTTHTAIYGVDMAVPFNFKTDKSKVYLDRAHFGITGRRTVTTPQGGEPGKPTFANTAFLETFFKVKTSPLTSLLPGQPVSNKVDSAGIFRMRFETPMGGKIDPRVTLRYDQPLWEVRNIVMGDKGKFEVKTQMRLEAIGAAQFGLNAQRDATMQNFTVGLRARF